MISSTQNPRIKWLCQLQSQARLRREERMFVAEGVRLAEEALQSSFQPRLVIYTEDLTLRGKKVLNGLAALGAVAEAVTENVMRRVSDTQSPQGLLVALERTELPIPSQTSFIFIPDLIRDPGNLGTMLRTAAAAGAEAVIIPPDTADPFAPKTLRSGMGAQFHLPILESDWEDISHRLKGLRVYLAASHEGTPYTQVDFRPPLTMIVGGEAEGASDTARQISTTRVQIPMPGSCESLNAAVAAGILMFEIVRQRTK